MQRHPVLRFALTATFVLACIWAVLYASQKEYECEYCWHTTTDEMQVVELDSGVICASCLTGDFYRCLECGRYRSIGDGYNTNLGLCDSCDPTPWHICSDCDRYYPDYQCAYYNDDYHCIDCMTASLS